MENENVPDEKDLTSISSSNMSELLSTNNEEKTESNDTLPTSSTDASTSFKSSNSVSDDPISSTSSEMETIKLKNSSETKQAAVAVVVAEVATAEIAEINQTIFQPIDETDLLDISMSKETDEKIEEIDDLVNDLETLLGESPDDFTLNYKSTKDKNKSPVKQTECFDIGQPILPDNEVTSNITTTTTTTTTTTNEKCPEQAVFSCIDNSKDNSANEPLEIKENPINSDKCSNESEQFVVANEVKINEEIIQKGDEVDATVEAGISLEKVIEENLEMQIDSKVETGVVSQPKNEESDNKIMVDEQENENNNSTVEEKKSEHDQQKMPEIESKETNVNKEETQVERRENIEVCPTENLSPELNPNRCDKDEVVSIDNEEGSSDVIDTPHQEIIEKHKDEELDLPIVESSEQNVETPLKIDGDNLTSEDKICEFQAVKNTEEIDSSSKQSLPDDETTTERKSTIETIQQTEQSAIDSNIQQSEIVTPYQVIEDTLETTELESTVQLEQVKDSSEEDREMEETSEEIESEPQKVLDKQEDSEVEFNAPSIINNETVSIMEIGESRVSADEPEENTVPVTEHVIADEENIKLEENTDKLQSKTFPETMALDEAKDIICEQQIEEVNECPPEKVIDQISSKIDVIASNELVPELGTTETIAEPVIQNDEIRPAVEDVQISSISVVEPVEQQDNLEPDQATERVVASSEIVQLEEPGVAKDSQVKINEIPVEPPVEDNKLKTTEKITDTNNSAIAEDSSKQDESLEVAIAASAPAENLKEENKLEQITEISMDTVTKESESIAQESIETLPSPISTDQSSPKVIIESELPAGPENKALNINIAVIQESNQDEKIEKEPPGNFTYLEETCIPSNKAEDIEEFAEPLEAEVNEETEEPQQENLNPFFDINVRRKTVEQDLRNIVCLSEESSDSDDDEHANNVLNIDNITARLKADDNEAIYDIPLMKPLPASNQEETDLIRIAKEVEELQRKESIPDLITDEEAISSGVDEILVEPSNVINVPLLQPQENNSFETILDVTQNKLSEKELREIEAIRRAVASITDSSQDTYDSYLGDNSTTIDNLMTDDMQQQSSFSEVSNNAVDAATYLTKISVEQQSIDHVSPSPSVLPPSSPVAVESFKETFLETLSSNVTIVQESSKEIIESPFKSISVTTELRPGLQITPIQTGSQETCGTVPEMTIEKISIKNSSKPTMIDDKENLVNSDNSLLFKSTADEQDDIEVETVNEKPVRIKTKKSIKVIEPLSVNVDDYDHRSYSPKVTIKPLKIPDEVVSTTSETESNKGSLKMTITKQSDKMHSVVKMVTVNDDLSPSKFLEQDSMRKSVSKQQLEQQHSPKTTRSSRTYSPTLQQRCSSPRITIKPVVEPKNESIKLTFRSIKPEEGVTKRHSPKIKSVKPSENTEEVSNDEEIEEIKSRIILKINKGNLQTPEKETRKREYPDDDKLEKLQKIKLKFSGGHPHIVQDGADENHKKFKKDFGNAGFKYSEECSIKRLSDDKFPEKIKKFKSTQPEDDLDCHHLKHNSPMNRDSNSPYKDDLRFSGMDTKKNESDSNYLLKISELASRTDHIQATPVVTVGVVTPTAITPPVPKRRGRPRKVPLEVREELKDVFNESQDNLTPNASPSSSIGTPEPCTSSSSSTGGRPKRSCRGQNVIATLGIKPRKPRGGGKGRGSKVNMGERMPSDTHLEIVQTAITKPEKEIKPSKAKLKLMQKEAEELIHEKTVNLSEPQPCTSKQADELEDQQHIEERTTIDEEHTLTKRLQDATSDPNIIIIEDDDSQSSFSKKDKSLLDVTDASTVKTDAEDNSSNTAIEKDLNDGHSDDAEEDIDDGDSEEDKRKEIVRQKKLEAIKKCRAKRMEKLAKAAEIKRKREEQAKMRREAKIAAEEADRVKSRTNKRYGRYGNPKPQISLIDEPVLESGGRIKSQKGLFNPVSKDTKNESMLTDDESLTLSQSNLDQSLPSTSCQKFMSESMLMESEDGSEIHQTIHTTNDIVMIDEETRMSADFKGSRAQTPVKHVVPQADASIDDSQGSTGGTTVESTTSRSRSTKTSRSEIHHDANAIRFIADQLAEYYWNEQGPFMLQEQVAQFLGIKSFKRKYPNIQRRAVEMQERDYLKENGLATEAQCDLGLTVVNGQDILDIMYSDFQDKYEDYCKVQRERQARELANKQKALTQQAMKPGYEKLDIIEQAVQSAAQWNKQFNKARREHRKASMDLQSFIIHYPKLEIKPSATPKPGNYPLALVPGQFTDYYKEYTATELNNLPLNTMCYDEIKIRQYESESDDTGSGSDSDSDTSTTSSSSDSSKDGGKSSAGDCKGCCNDKENFGKVNGSGDGAATVNGSSSSTVTAVAAASGSGNSSSLQNSEST